MAWAKLRLPTEDEWEYAARGDEAFEFPYGRDLDPRRINSSGKLDLAPDEPGDRFLTTAPVDSLEIGRGPFGCYHLGGNVMELAISTSASAESNHAQKVLPGYVGRGGSWVSQPAYCSALTRFPIEDKGEGHDLGQETGFRVARSLE